MNSYKTYIYLALLTLLGCKGNDGNEPQALTPQIRYEFSGGAGHYNYVRIVIRSRLWTMFIYTKESPQRKAMYGNPAHRSSNLPKQVGITATSATRTYVSLKRLIKEKLTTGL